MADNAQKLWIQGSLNRIANKKTLDNLQLQVKAMPVSVTAIKGNLVTVKFELQSNFTIPSVTVPKAESPYFSAPVQVGDKGYVVPADFYMGGVSDNGGGVANAYPRANLTNGVFVPVRSKSARATSTTKVQIGGPNGSIIGTLDGSVTLDIDKTGNAVLTLPAGKTLVIKNLPTSDPGVSGALWNNANTVKVSP